MTHSRREEERCYSNDRSWQAEERRQSSLTESHRLDSCACWVVETFIGIIVVVSASVSLTLFLSPSVFCLGDFCSLTSQLRHHYPGVIPAHGLRSAAVTQIQAGVIHAHGLRSTAATEAQAAAPQGASLSATLIHKIGPDYRIGTVGHRARVESYHLYFPRCP